MTLSSQRPGSWFLVQELCCCCCGVHDVGPDLLFRCHGPFGHRIVRHPRSELAAWNEAEDGGDQAPGDRSDDADGDVGLVPLIGKDLDAQGSAIEHLGVLMPVEE
jgi:hypothetical protein